MNNAEQLKELFKNKILGIRNYKSDKKEFSADDFTDFKILVDFLWEVDTGESDITPAGQSFMEKYFGFDELAKMLVSKGYNLPPENTETNEQSVSAWLKSLEPMQTISFIEQARGNIQNGAALREDLLPPKL